MAPDEKIGLLDLPNRRQPASQIGEPNRCGLRRADLDSVSAAELDGGLLDAAIEKFKTSLAAAGTVGAFLAGVDCSLLSLPHIDRDQT
jgi:asparagine synthetase B (glutamine-hydrolysing)